MRRPKPVGADERIPPRAEHAAPITVPESEMTVQEITPTYDNVDFDLSDDSPTEENLVLDADLVDGTGFDDSGDADLNQQFGFAATMDLDLELPATADIEDTSPETDIIPPPERPEDLIVSSEVLPDDDDEYDISMVVDATKMPDPAEVTERDLRAVPIDDTGQMLMNDDYTIVDEIGQDILEKDYEDEMSATQLLNAEIEKAAAELAETIGEEDPTATERPRRIRLHPREGSEHRFGFARRWFSTAPSGIRWLMVQAPVYALLHHSAMSSATSLDPVVYVGTRSLTGLGLQGPALRQIVTESKQARGIKQTNTVRDVQTGREILAGVE